MKTYSAYKESGEDWMGSVPEHWRVERLKDVCEDVLGGGTPKTGDERYWDEGDIIWVTPTDYQDFEGQETIDDSKLKITKLGMTSSAARLLPIGTVLMTSRASIGDAKISSAPLTTNQGFMNFVCGTKYQNKFLFYIINSSLGYIFKNIATGTTYLEISKRVAKQEKVPLPPYTEQTAITVYLDKATADIDTVIKLKNEQLDKLDDYKKSILHEAVTKGLNKKVELTDSNIDWIGKYPKHWKLMRLKDCSDYIQTGSTPPTSVSEYYENGTIEWFSPPSFEGELELTNPAKLINEKAYTDGELKMFPANSVFLIGIGGTIGKSAIIRKPSSCNQQLNVIKPDCRIEVDFLAFFMKIYEDVIINIAQFTTLPIFNQTKTGLLHIVVPPQKKEQKEIAEFLYSTMKKIKSERELIEQQIEKLKEYRKALIHECVTGKRKVTSD